ncbi:peptidoglycan editing factor PgeF [Candidatus Parcubacteria bacterium]|nr:peptidoglycan editing factor PgeF [Candidatus Parcubacteria bacterium]
MKHPLIEIFYTKKPDGNMNFQEFRQNFLEKHKISRKPIVVEQIHGKKVILVDKNYNQKQKADGMITNDKNVVLISRMSDCIPVLFLDPLKKAIAVIHAGREGTFQNISGEAVQKFISEFNSDPKNILVEIGPGICGDCYEVSREMVDFVRDNFGEKFLTGGANNRNINLKAINEKHLVDSGILPENISNVGICTRCGDKNYFSYRKNPEEGNFATMIYLK